MREYTSPLSVELSTSGSLTDDLLRNAQDAPDQALLSRKTESGWSDVSAAAFLAQVRAVAKGLVAAGVGPGDRIALLSRTRYEWTLVDYATWYVGAVTVPIYETSSEDQVEWILSDSGARAIVVESSEHLSRVKAIRKDLPELRHTWSFDENGIDGLTALGADVPDDEIESRRSAVTPDTAATIIYTSGTTGRPKGCELTHGNFMTELETAVSELDSLFIDGSSTLLILPLAHVFARILQIGAIKARVRLGHTAGVKNLLSDLAEFQPTFLLAVPRVFEKVFNTASQRAASDGRAASSTAPRTQRSPTAAPSTRARSARSSAAGTPSSTGWSTRDCAKRSAATASSRSPVGHHSANASATSTGASASPSSRATASQRPPQRSLRTSPTPTRSAPSAARCRASPSASPTTASCSSRAARS